MTNTNVVVFVQSLSRVRLSVTPWAVACQASLSFTISLILLRLISPKSVLPSNHLILCRPRHEPLRKNREGLTWWPSDKDSTLPVQGVQVRSPGGIKNPHALSPGTCVLDCVQLFLTLSAGPSVHGILQARTLEWAAISSSGNLPIPGLKPASPAFAGDPLPLRHRESPQAVWSTKKNRHFPLHRGTMAPTWQTAGKADWHRVAG